MNATSYVRWLLAPACCCLWAAAAPAQVYYSNSPQGDATPGITVQGSAEITARPNIVVINLRTAGKAEIADDAITKYRDAKKKTTAAFDALGLKNLQMTEFGLTFGPANSAEIMQAMWNGMPATANKKMEMEISSGLRLELSEVRDVPPEELLQTIGKLLDTAQDAGSAVGPSQAEYQMAYRYGRQMNSQIVSFVLRDILELREKAYERAVGDARARAERLAKLNGVALGSVISVSELQVSGDERSTGVTQPWEAAAPVDATVPPQIVSQTFSEIPFRVRLLVRFSIEKPAAAKEAAKTALR